MKKISARLLKNSGYKAGSLVIYFILICVSFVYMEPVFRVISKTFMSAANVIDPAVEWLPRASSTENLRIAARVLNSARWWHNSTPRYAVALPCRTRIVGPGYVLREKLWITAQCRQWAETQVRGALALLARTHMPA